MPDLSKFIDANEKHKAAGPRRRVPWAERAAMIVDEFPSVRELNWDAALTNEDLLVRVLKDILKVDQIDPTRDSGARPALDIERGMQTWQEIMGRQFCELPFDRAFKALAHDESIRTIAERTHIAKSLVHRLITGEEKPTVDHMRTVAEAYGKKPQFFLEYRAEYVMAAIASRFVDDPELVEVVYMKLVRLG